MLSGDPYSIDESTLDSREKKALDRTKKWTDTGRAYALEHSTRTSTIGHVLASNPLSLLAWIGEKFLEWSDDSPPLDTILTNISLYWFTEGYPTSLYPYRTLFALGRKPLPYITKPFGFSFFPVELFPGVKSAAEKAGNLVHYTQHERGGHFAALEKPGELWEDVQAFVSEAWKEEHGAKL
jgi:microsomal epoxide hydrolase